MTRTKDINLDGAIKVVQRRVMKDSVIAKLGAELYVYGYDDMEAKLFGMNNAYDRIKLLSTVEDTRLMNKICKILGGDDYKHLVLEAIGTIL